MFIREQNIGNIAKNLKNYRISHNKKQTEMADILKMNYQNYSKMERGVYQPSLEKLLEICDTLHLTPNDLLLEGRNFDDFKKEHLEEMDNNVIDMLDTMHIIEEQRAAAAAAHCINDYSAERFNLDVIFHILIKDDETNQNYKKMIDTLYYDYINNYIKKFSDQTFQKFYEKKLQEELERR